MSACAPNRLAAAGRTKVGARFIVPSTAEGAAKPRPYPQPPCGGQAVGSTGAQGETGNPMIGRGALISGAYIPVSGLPLIVMISLRVAGGSPGWPVAGLFHSVLHSVLNAALHSDLRDRFRPPSSVIDSVICHRFRDRFSPPFVLCRQINHPPSRMAFVTPKPEKATK